MRSLLPCCCAILLFLGLSSGPAAAAPAVNLPAAKAHFAQGKAFFEQGNLQLARAEFEESYRLSRRPDLLFNLALVAEKLGGYRESADYLIEYLRQRPGATDRRGIQRAIDDLLRRDGARRRAERKERSAPVLAPEPPEPTPLSRPVLVAVTPAPAVRQRAPWPAFALLGGGAALLIAGGALGGSAVAAARSVEQRFDPATEERGLRLEAAGIALDVIGAAAVAVGGIWTIAWLSRRGERARLSLVPQAAGMGLSGSF